MCSLIYDILSPYPLCCTAYVLDKVIKKIRYRYCKTHFCKPPSFLCGSSLPLFYTYIKKGQIYNKKKIFITMFVMFSSVLLIFE
jgi:hypothetical protein